MSDDENPLVLRKYTSANPIFYCRMDNFKNEIKSYLGLQKIKNIEEIKNNYDPGK